MNYMTAHIYLHLYTHLHIYIHTTTDVKMKLQLNILLSITFAAALVPRQCYIDQNMKPVCISPPYVTTNT